jgi:hypothetical protein
MHLPQVFSRRTDIALPHLALIAATRGMAGFGLGVLLSNRIPQAHRRTVGWALFLTGALSTIPLVAGVIRGIRSPR